MPVAAAHVDIELTVAPLVSHTSGWPGCGPVPITSLPASSMTIRATRSIERATARHVFAAAVRADADSRLNGAGAVLDTRQRTPAHDRCSTTTDREPMRGPIGCRVPQKHCLAAAAIRVSVVGESAVAARSLDARLLVPAGHRRAWREPVGRSNKARERRGGLEVDRGSGTRRSLARGSLVQSVFRSQLHGNGAFDDLHLTESACGWPFV